MSTTNSTRAQKEEDEDHKVVDRANNLLSKDLKEFYASHNVELSGLLNASIQDTDMHASPFPYRFIRLNPRYDRSETLKLLKEELKKNIKEPIPVPWLDKNWGFYALPADFALASSNSFRSGRVYGMDVSSGAGAAALLSTLYDKDPFVEKCDTADKKEIRVLDLCCCPGIKLCAMADFLKDRDAFIVGVDVSENRMALCKKIVQKYHVDKETCGTIPSSGEVNIQLYCQDGTTFGLNNAKDNNPVFDYRAALEEFSARGKRKRMNKSARARERKRLRQLTSADWVATCTAEDSSQDETPIIKLFDYVLVDAECSTDGSLKHMKERMKESSSKSKQETNLMLIDQAQLADLVALQKRLIASGFRLLKPGGTMVYSTCSLSEDQNENVVQWLLDNNAHDAVLIPVHFPLAKSKLVLEGSLHGTVRFNPNLGQESSDYFGDGFFLAKIGRLLPKKPVVE